MSINKSMTSFLSAVLCAAVLSVPITAQQRAIINPSTETPAFLLFSNQRWNEGQTLTLQAKDSFTDLVFVAN